MLEKLSNGSFGLRSNIDVEMMQKHEILCINNCGG